MRDAGGICCECEEAYSRDLHDLMQDDWSNYCTCISGTIYPFPQPKHVRSTEDFVAILPCPVGGACLGSTHVYALDNPQQNFTCFQNATCLSYGECGVAYVDRLCGDCSLGYYQVCFTYMRQTCTCIPVINSQD